MSGVPPLTGKAMVMPEDIACALREVWTDDPRNRAWLVRSADAAGWSRVATAEALGVHRNSLARAVRVEDANHDGPRSSLEVPSPRETDLQNRPKRCKGEVVVSRSEAMRITAASAGDQGVLLIAYRKAGWSVRDLARLFHTSRSTMHARLSSLPTADRMGDLALPSVSPPPRPIADLRRDALA